MTSHTLAKLRVNPFWPSSFADPFVLKVRGRYYAYATEHAGHPPDGSQVFPILTSTDLVSWQEVGKALPTLGQPYFFYWAPEVTVYNDQFLLYYAVHTEEFKSGIRVAVADRPEGPFIDTGHDLTSSIVPWAIDPHVFRDQDGQWYLYMTIEYLEPSTGFIGSGNAVDRLLNPFTLQGNITRVTPPSQAWQLFEAQRESKGGIDWYTVEGPTVVRHRKRYYEMYSGGCFYRDNYAVSYATSATPMGPGGLHDTSWHDWQGTEDHILLLHGDREHLISPGHNSFVLGPNNVDQYIAYHALQPDMIERRPCLDRLFWHGDVLWTPAPTYTPQPTPAMPRIHDLFEEPELHPAWHNQSGDWYATYGEVVQRDSKVESALLNHQDILGTAWLLEVNLRYIAGNGTYGVLLQDGNGTATRLVITSDAQLIWSNDNKPGRTISLPDHVVLPAWHQLTISSSGSVLTVQLDGIRVAEDVIKHFTHSFALLTEHCSAAFTAISLTDHFLDEFLNDQYTPALLGWSTQSEEMENASSLADWQVQNGALEQTSMAHGEHLLLKSLHQEQYEFSATLKLSHNQQEQSAFGLVIWKSSEEKLFIWLSQNQSGWTLTVESSDSPPEVNASHDLPANFNPMNWHTLRLERETDSLKIALDGPELLTLPLSPNLTSVGLATRNAATAFTGVSLTGRPVI